MTNKISSKILTFLENEPNADWAVAQLMAARKEVFYGKVTFQFEAGKIVILRKEQTQKPPRVLVPGDNDNGQ